MSNWFSDYRETWITEMVRIYGFINREHVMRKFGVSVVQASTDLKRVREKLPGYMDYDTSKKCYVYNPNWMEMR